jgi:hypothetical protein
MFGTAQTNAMEGRPDSPAQVVGPVELGPSSYAPVDDVLTKHELAAWLKMSKKWVENNTRARRFPGQFKAGGEWRFKRIEIERNILVTKQVLLPREKD